MTALAAKQRDASEYLDDPVAAIRLDDEGPSGSPRHTRRVFAASTGTIALLLAALYLWCPVHRFPRAQPFHGALWYNPYAAISPMASWRKVNLHVHARAWSGLTNGHGSADDVQRRYRELGYDAAPVSDYQAITRTTGGDARALVVYEQGFNLRKVHFLAVGARRVDWLDYPLLQGRDEEQHRIDRLRATAPVVILAHPRLRRGVPDADLRVITGYTAMEIGSNASQADDAWTVALDAGRPVWGVANDDTHDASAPNEAGGFWSMIASPSNDAAGLVGALVAGRVYAVFGRGGQADVALSSLAVVGDTMSVSFHGAPARLQLIGPGGRVLEEVNQAHDARWTLPCDAAWVRVIARTSTTQLSLEPLLRSENGALPRVDASVAPTPTLARRAIAIMLVFIAILPWLGGDVLRFPRAVSARPRLALR